MTKINYSDKAISMKTKIILLLPVLLLFMYGLGYYYPELHKKITLFGLLPLLLILVGASFLLLRKNWADNFKANRKWFLLFLLFALIDVTITSAYVAKHGTGDELNPLLEPMHNAFGYWAFPLAFLISAAFSLFITATVDHQDKIILKGYAAVYIIVVFINGVMFVT